MELEKNMLLINDDYLLRVLCVKPEAALIIDCKTKGMPKWRAIEELSAYEQISEEELYELTGSEPVSESALSQKEIVRARQRYALIAPVLPLLDDDALRTASIKKIAEASGVSRRTIGVYLCQYLVFQNIWMLSGYHSSTQKKELTIDQKNMRWALNKFYYTRKNNPLTVAYIQMLKEKYTDENGKLLSGYPTINQFRYFFQKTRKKQTEIISRKGIKEYQLNHRPLLGEIQDMATSIGWDA